MSNRKAGIIIFKIGGIQRQAKGSFTYNFGKPKRDAIVGHDTVHGYKELPQVSQIQGIITDASDLDVATDILDITNTTITLELANGKVFVLRNAWYSGEGNITTEEAEIEVQFQGLSGTEI